SYSLHPLYSFFSPLHPSPTATYTLSLHDALPIWPTVPPNTTSPSAVSRPTHNNPGRTCHGRRSTRCRPMCFPSRAVSHDSAVSVGPRVQAVIGCCEFARETHVDMGPDRLLPA